MCILTKITKITKILRLIVVAITLLLHLSLLSLPPSITHTYKKNSARSEERATHLGLGVAIRPFDHSTINKLRKEKKNGGRVSRL